MGDERVPLVRCVDVSRAYVDPRVQPPAVIDVTCEVVAAQTVALVGPSGSGKSTLIHLMAQLDRPTAGEIGWPALADEPANLPGAVGVVFQAPSLIDSLTAAENVALALLASRVEAMSEALNAARDLLSDVGVGALAERLPSELSAGQAQRVAVVRAIAPSPRLLLADEPTGKLDRRTATQLLKWMVAVATAHGTALVIASHDPTVVELVDDQWTMTDGRLRIGAHERTWR